MTAKSVTTQVRLLKFGDVWNGPFGPESVTGIDNSFRPQNMDITLTSVASSTTRTVTVNRDQLFMVQRDDAL